MELITHTIGVMSESQLLDILFELMDIVSSNKNVKFHTTIETESSTVRKEFIITNSKTNKSIFILRRHKRPKTDDGMEIVSTTIDKDYNFEKEFPQLNIILQEIQCDKSHKQ